MAPGAAARLVLALVLAAPAALHGAEQRLHAASRHRGNPVRKVVNLLAEMQKKVTEEGKKEEAAYEKFMCHCKTSGDSLAESIEKGKVKQGSLTSGIKEATQKRAQTEQDLREHREARAEAEEAMSKAEALRQNEAKAFAKEEAESKANVAALEKAIPAIEGAMGGAFLQTKDAEAVRQYTMLKADLPDETREEVLAFLSGKQSEEYAPRSGEIVGVLKQMHEEMAKNLQDATQAEEEAVKSHADLMRAKKKEVATLTAQIEEEQSRFGDLGVQLAAMAHDLQDTEESLEEDGRFLAELGKGCGTATGEFKKLEAARTEELVAISDTIKILNDDNALDLFKKTLPSAGSSFLQIQVTSAAVRSRALAAIHGARRRHRRGSALRPRPELELIALALSGKQTGFDKVLGMVDNMVSNLQKEQRDDDAKKEYCETQLDEAEDKKKGFERSIKDSKTAIEEMKGSIETLTEEVAELESGIRELDGSVAEATALRKSEHQEFSEKRTQDAAAKEVLLWAKNRLNKFYNPKMYVAPPAGGEEEEGPSLLQVSARARDEAPPPPPPETFGAYTKKSEESSGVLAMIDTLVRDLEKELTEAKAAEKIAQEDYEAMVSEAGQKRADDAKSITDKTSAKASEEEALEVETNKKVGETKDFMVLLDFIQNLHGECDPMLQTYEARKEARASEIEALGKAKDVLNGADYSFLQTGSAVSGRGFLAMH